MRHPRKGKPTASLDYESIFAATPTPHLILSPDLTILDVNDAYLKATNTRRDAIFGRHLFDVFPDNPSDSNATGVHNLCASLERVRATRAADTMAIQKYDIPRSETEGDGFDERYWSQINSPVLSDLGEITYIIHRVEDVTEFVHAQRLVTASDETQADARRFETELFLRNREIAELNQRLWAANSELTSADRLKTKFFQNVNHEFRTPLTLVLGPLEALLADDALRDDPRRQLVLAHRNALRLQKLVNMLLEFSRVEAGRVSASFEATDLSALTAELASAFRSAIEHAGLRLIVVCPPLPELVFIDREMWESIVLNLVSNAFKFTHKGQITVTLAAKGDHAELSVQDTGTGIAKKDIPRLFTRFHRIEERRARVREGAGIGLALTKELTALHKGTIRVDSIYGQGSTFVVEIPFGRAHLPADTVRPEHTPLLRTGTHLAHAFVQEALSWLPDGDPMATVSDGDVVPSSGTVLSHILVVDDNTDMRGYLSRLLSPHYYVESVADGVAALASLHRRPPDLVLSDIMLTGMSGIDLLKEIRGNPNTASLPVILVSGSGGSAAIVQGLAAGADDYLPKPFLAQELLARIAAQLAQAQHIRREQELRREAEAVKSRLEVVLESVSDAIVGVTEKGQISYLNGRAARRAMQPKEKLVGAELATIFPGEGGSLIREHLPNVQQNRTPARLEYFSEAHSCWFETRLFPTPGGAVIFSGDITRRKHAEHQLKEVLARLRMASEIAELGFWEWNPANDAVYFSPEWYKQLGFADGELHNRIEEWKFRLHPDDIDRVMQQIANFAHSPTPDFETEYRLEHKDGSYRWINARCIAFTSEEGTERRIAITHLDVTERKKEIDRISYFASHDALTGLPNRAMLNEFATHLIGSARRLGGKVAFLFLDLDHFKPINDMYGHKIGDRVLQEAAQRIVGCLRADDLVGRLGGDEFVAVLSKLAGQQQEVTRAARQCIEVLSRPYVFDHLELRAPTSIGISLFPDDGDSVESLIQNADVAMYQAKAKGGSTYQIFTPELGATPQAPGTLERRMKIDLETQAFQLVYQPIFDSQTNQVTAVEALIRWPGTNMEPVNFIPIAEAGGLIHTMGEWAIKEACSQLLKWVEQGLPMVPMAINVSPKQFFDMGFVSGVTQAIADSGVAPRYVYLDIPVSTLNDDFGAAAAILEELKGRGIQTEVDDFGQGTFSQESLRRLPINALKVNVRTCSTAQLDAILELGQTSGLDIIAEQIESEDELELLRRRKCGLQGYQLCRPIRGNAFPEWYAHRL